MILAGKSVGCGRNPAGSPCRLLGPPIKEDENGTATTAKFLDLIELVPPESEQVVEIAQFTFFTGRS